jgi:Mg2+ and Co2+ transporter CorA
MQNFVYRNYTVEYLFDSSTTFGGYGDVSLPPQNFDNLILFYQIDPSKSPEKQIEEIEEIKSKVSLITNLVSDKRIVILTLQQNYQNNWQIKYAELSDEINKFNNEFLKELLGNKSNVKVLDINQFFEKQTIDKVD